MSETDTETMEVERRSQTRDRSIVVAGHRGVELRSLDDFYRFAQYVVSADMVPPGIKNEAGVLIAIQRGAEVGLLPMQALQSIYIVNNQPHLFGDAPKAIVEASGLLEYCKEYEEGKYPDDSYRWVCKLKRRGRDERLSTFSIADAKTAQLWEKKSKDGTRPTPWVLYPKRMLMWRARGYGLRDEFPDVLKGFPIRELADDDDAAFARARPALGSVVEPRFQTTAPSAPAPPEEPKRGRGRPPKPKEPEKPPEQIELPKESLFAGLASPQRAESEPKQKEKETATPTPLELVKSKLEEGGFSKEDFLHLLCHAGLFGTVEQEEITLGHVVFADVPEASLKSALDDWENVTMALGQKVWTQSR